MIRQACLTKSGPKPMKYMTCGTPVEVAPPNFRTQADSACSSESLLGNRNEDDQGIFHRRFMSFRRFGSGQIEETTTEGS